MKLVWNLMFFDFLSSSQKNLIIKKSSIAIFLLCFFVGILYIMKFLSESDYSISYVHFINDNEPSLKNTTIWNKNISFIYSTSIYNEKKHTYEPDYSNNNFKLYNLKSHKLVDLGETTKIQYHKILLYLDILIMSYFMNAKILDVKKKII